MCEKRTSWNTYVRLKFSTNRILQGDHLDIFCKDIVCLEEVVYFLDICDSFLSNEIGIVFYSFSKKFFFSLWYFFLE